MNLPQFLQTVDTLTAEMEKEKLKKCIHELARTLPESQRQFFLNILNFSGAHENIKDDPNSKQTKGAVSSIKKSQSELKIRVKAAMKALSDLESDGKTLECRCNEEYDDWYNNEEDEYLFFDPNGLIKDIENAIDLVHLCLDEEEYKSGYELAESLSTLVIGIESDYDFYEDSFKIKNLFATDLIDGDMSGLVIDSLILNYMASKSDERAENLYNMAENFGYAQVTLEKILQKAPRELPQFDLFLLDWINCLGCKTGKSAEDFILEAQMMLKEKEQQIEVARRFSDRFPKLYLQLLRNESKLLDDTELWLIGKEALLKIPVHLVIRSKIALETASAINRMERKEEGGREETYRNEREECWIEALRSNTSIISYLRLRFNACDWSRIRPRVTEIFEEAYQSARKGEEHDLTLHYKYMWPSLENMFSTKSYLTFLYFENRFEEMIQLGMNIQESLGWSGTFMKDGIALLLLALYKEKLTEKKIEPGIRKMISWAENVCAFSVGDYYRGTMCETYPVDENTTSTELFAGILEQWKKDVIISEKQEDCWMEMIDELLDRRTNAIMQANRRNYYNECAAFIAAYGEVEESRGFRGAKEEIMSVYKNDYSRRVAFHRELRSFGMK